MSKRDVWEFTNPHDDVFALADYLDAKANSVNFTFEDDSEADAFFLKCRDEFAFFAPRCLTLKSKDGDLRLFKFNRAQRYLNAVAEWQKHHTGMVRIIIVKGRQQGISTYTEGRAYHQVIHQEAHNVYIMAHEDAASNGLFDMSKRYHEHCPEDLRPVLGHSNGKQMKFPGLDSQYTIATAGNKSAGRSATARFFHGSEVAFWPNAAEHASGVLQTIPRSPGTEVYLESTADGISNYFYDQWERAASIGDIDNPDASGYVRVFIPWFWQPEYAVEPPARFIPTDEEKQYQRRYAVSDSQLYWRRLKIKEMDGDIRRFQRDYPATPEEAFNASGDAILITGEMVADAKAWHREGRLIPQGAVVMGVDVAREGDDATCFVIRQGRVVLHKERMYKAKSHVVANRLMTLRDEYGVDHTFVDATGGFGTAVLDMLEVRGALHNTTGVHFNESALEDSKFANVRTEMWWKIREWLLTDVALPDNEDWGRDLCAPQYRFEGDKIRLEKKEEIKKRIGRSPDMGDALALTFRFPVNMALHQGGYEPEEV